VSKDEKERLMLWSGRKSAFPAVGRLTPDYYCMDGTIPRRALARVLLRIEELEKEYGLRCANVFHAGDGNLHPLIFFDANVPTETERTEAFGAKILELCIEVGGTITGEHGVGIEKLSGMCSQFAPAELERFLGVKAAFDAHSLLNPGKGVPTLARCAEFGKMHVHHGNPPGAAVLARARAMNLPAELRRTRPDARAVTDLVTRLTADLGARAVTTRAIRDQHSHGEGLADAGLPDVVVFPRSNDEVAAIVRLCHAARVPVIAFGVGTSLEGHVAALYGGVSLDLSQMNRVLEVNAADLDCRVQAGVTHEQLNAELKGTGLFFPIDPGADATIGGMAQRARPVPTRSATARCART
jgi:FAD/FMN-containing dehydrogenase